MIMDNHNFWGALGNSPNEETRKGNVPVFDNTLPYHIPSEITGHFCHLIGSQQRDSLEVSVFYIYAMMLLSQT